MKEEFNQPDLTEQTALFGVRLTVAYDGTNFSGWAKQPSQRTVQGELEKTIKKMVGHSVEARAAGRTDAGVHALAQPVAFDSLGLIPARGWMLGLNKLLPEDVAVQDAIACMPGYNPRFDAVDKIYRYLLLRGEVRDPLLHHRAWFLGPLGHKSGQAGFLSIDRMREGAANLLGTHDFRAFRASDDGRENTVRTIHRIDVYDGFAGDPRLIAIEVQGNAFMKNMVRILVGTLIEVGRERMDPNEIPNMLGVLAKREQAGPTAPAHGLYMVQVRLGRNVPQFVLPHG